LVWCCLPGAIPCVNAWPTLIKVTVNKNIFRIILGGLTILVLGACAGGSPPTRFYALEVAPKGIPAATQSNLSIGLGPLTLPDSLNRPQILVRPEAYRRELAEFDHWAGDLKNNLARILGARLGERLGTQRIFLYPWPRFRHTDLQVQVDVWRFEGRPGGEAELYGSWTLLDGEGQRELSLDAFTLRQPVRGLDYRDLVAAMSNLVAQLADRIAQAVALGRHRADRDDSAAGPQ